MNQSASRAFRETGVESEEACERDDRKRKRGAGGKGEKSTCRGQRGRGNVDVEQRRMARFRESSDADEPPRVRRGL